MERPLVFASAFDNGLADREFGFKRFNGNNQATSCPSLVNFRPIISEFTLLKTAAMEFRLYRVKEYVLVASCVLTCMFYCLFLFYVCTIASFTAITLWHVSLLCALH